MTEKCVSIEYTLPKCVHFKTSLHIFCYSRAGSVDESYKTCTHENARYSSSKMTDFLYLTNRGNAHRGRENTRIYTQPLTLCCFKKSCPLILVPFTKCPIVRATIFGTSGNTVLDSTFVRHLFQLFLTFTTIHLRPIGVGDVPPD